MSVPPLPNDTDQPQQDIYYVKVGVQSNWKQLFLRVTYSIFKH